MNAVPSNFGKAAQEPSVKCWSCAQTLTLRAPFCHACGSVQPPRPLDHFARLGLPADFPVDKAALDRQYFGLQRSLHPDRFARKTPKEKAISQQHAASLNEAYDALKEPLRAATYLAGLRGVELPADGKTVADPELLMEAMEVREALQEAQRCDEVDALAADARERKKAVLDRLPDLFGRNDREGLRNAILRLRYLERFAEEARARRANLASST